MQAVTGEWQREFQFQCGDFDIVCRKELCDLLIDFVNVTKKRITVGFSRQDKAAAVKHSAFALMERIRLVESDEFVNYYIHCAFFHLPDQILRCPIDVNDASGASIEHIHQPVKRAFLYVNTTSPNHFTVILTGMGQIDTTNTSLAKESARQHAPPKHLLRITLQFRLKTPPFGLFFNVARNGA